MDDLFAPNDRVIHRDHPEFGLGTVKLVESDPLGEHTVVAVAFDWKLGSIPCPPERIERVPPIASSVPVDPPELGNADELRRRLGAAITHAENARTGAFIRSFISPLPHQAYLLEKIHYGRRYGHLIADDVGMGKTIEAGLLISSLLRENERARVLVLSPKGLVLQWQDEMREHFNLSFSVAGHDFTADNANLWDQVNLVIASIDTLKQERYQRLLLGTRRFDLVVCDEAHRLTARRDFLAGELVRTQAYRFVEWLGVQGIVVWEYDGEGHPRSPRLLLLTATPHQGDNLRFAYLLQLARPDLVNPDKGKPLPEDEATLRDCITRTPKHRAVDWEGKGIFKGHQVQTHDLQITKQESEILKALSRYVREEMTIKSSGRAEALVRTLALHTYQKIAASSWSALSQSLRARLEGRRPSEGDLGESIVLEIQELGEISVSEERMALERLIERIDSLQGDSKLDYFLNLVLETPTFRNRHEKVLVFTQYRETQELLRKELERKGQSVALIHGGLSLEERVRQRAFFEDSADILISTEAGSEGANLQRKCHLMVTYDLSWNPMRMLQRIGRLDRFGQTEMVKVVNIRQPEAWDSIISQKILDKLAVAGITLSRIAEEDYVAMIMGEAFESINVVEVMARAQWGEEADLIDEVIAEEVACVLENETTLKKLCRTALGMPEDYSARGAEIGPDEFRAAFSWAAFGHGIRLLETRTSDNRFLPGVYHFTLPEAFRATLRGGRECYLVFDRERFSEVRGETLGRARGQEIRPELAGLGDPVTDWFFRSSLSASSTGSVFSMASGKEVDLNEAWWIVWVASWRKIETWRGPDSVFVVALDREGVPLRTLPPSETMARLASCVDLGISVPLRQPPLEQARSYVREELKALLNSEGPFDRSLLSLVPWIAVRWNSDS